MSENVVTLIAYKGYVRLYCYIHSDSIFLRRAQRRISYDMRYDRTTIRIVVGAIYGVFQAMGFKNSVYGGRFFSTNRPLCEKDSPPPFV